MNDVDDELRMMLAERADDIPVAVGLLDGVQARVRQARNRRLALTSVAAVVVLLAGFALAFSARDGDRLVTADPAAPHGLKAPGSPVTATWVPAGFTKPKAYVVAANTWVIRASRTTPQVELTILVSPTALKERTTPGTYSHVSVDGKPAKTYTVPKHEPGDGPYGKTPPTAEGPFSELTYERAPGQWIRIDVHAYGNVDMGVSDADLQKIAKGLVDRVSPVPDLLRFASIPDGFTFSDVWDLGAPGLGAVVQLAKAGAAPQLAETSDGGHVLYTASDTMLVVQVGSAIGGPHFKGQIRTIRIDGRDVTITTNTQPQPNGRKPRILEEVVVSLKKGQVVQVLGSAALGLSAEQLARFALGISPGKDYRCCLAK